MSRPDASPLAADTRSLLEALVRKEEYLAMSIEALEGEKARNRLRTSTVRVLDELRDEAGRPEAPEWIFPVADRIRKELGGAGVTLAPFDDPRVAALGRRVLAVVDAKRPKEEA